MGVEGAKLGFPGTGFAVRCNLGAVWVTAPPVDDVHHAIKRMAGAELRLFTACIAMVRSGGATWVPTPRATGVHHSILSVFSTEHGLSGSFNAVRWPGLTTWIFAPLGADVNHALLGVGAAILCVARSLHAVARPFAAPLMDARLSAPPDVDHSLLSMLQAELRLLCPCHGERRLLVATWMDACHLSDGYHSLPRMLGAELRLLGAFQAM